MEVSRDVHRADEHIAAQPYDRSDDGLNAADGGDHAALVVVRTHPPRPSRPRTWPHRDRRTSLCFAKTSSAPQVIDSPAPAGHNRGS